MLVVVEEMVCESINVINNSNWNVCMFYVVVVSLMHMESKYGWRLGGKPSHNATLSKSSSPEPIDARDWAPPALRLLCGKSRQSHRWPLPCRCTCRICAAAENSPRPSTPNRRPGHIQKYINYTNTLHMACFNLTSYKEANDSRVRALLELYRIELCLSNCKRNT